MTEYTSLHPSSATSVDLATIADTENFGVRMRVHELTRRILDLYVHAPNEDLAIATSEMPLLADKIVNLLDGASPDKTTTDEWETGIDEWTRKKEIVPVATLADFEQIHSWWLVHKDILTDTSLSRDFHDGEDLIYMNIFFEIELFFVLCKEIRVLEEKATQIISLEELITLIRNRSLDGIPITGIVYDRVLELLSKELAHQPDWNELARLKEIFEIITTPYFSAYQSVRPSLNGERAHRTAAVRENLQKATNNLMIRKWMEMIGQQKAAE